MRIIAGKYRGRTLAAFRGDAVRPTSDRVKESVFQILSPRLVGATVLDLFCGSGALGLECLSRGAKEVVFNDSSKDSLALLAKNLARVQEERTVMNRDFRACLSSGRRYDFIFSDPPYKEDFLGEILRLTEACGALNENGLVVHESEREEVAPEGWQVKERRNYGRTSVYFLQRSEQ